MNIITALIISAFAQDPPIRGYTCEMIEQPRAVGKICIYDKLKCKIYGIELFKYTACAVKNGKCPDVDTCIDDESVTEYVPDEIIPSGGSSSNNGVAK